MVLFHIESITVNAGYVAIKLTKDQKRFLKGKRIIPSWELYLQGDNYKPGGMALKLPYASAILNRFL
jgi:hypothetical protein